jgi:hypothetical protein
LCRAAVAATATIAALRSGLLQAAAAGAPATPPAAAGRQATAPAAGRAIVTTRVLRSRRVHAAAAAAPAGARAVQTDIDPSNMTVRSTTAMALWYTPCHRLFDCCLIPHAPANMSTFRERFIAACRA